MKIWVYMNFITDKYNELVYIRMMLVVKWDETNQNREKMVNREEKKMATRRKNILAIQSRSTYGYTTEINNDKRRQNITSKAVKSSQFG